MATNDYTINFTDQNPSKDILVQENKFYGQQSPVSYATSIGAITGSKTSLTLYGKNTPNYGEKIQENLIYLLENFSGSVEPAYPVAGQLWFDRGGLGQLKVFNSNRYNILSSVLMVPSASSSKFQITINGTSLERDRLISLISKNIILCGPGAVNNPNVVNPNPIERYISGIINIGGVTFINSIITIILDVLDGTLTNMTGWSIGGWDNLLQASDTQDGFNAIGNKVINAGDPDFPQDLTTKFYVDTSITATRDYTDSEIAAISGTFNGMLSIASGDIRYINVIGDTMSGNLIFSSGTVTGLPSPVNPSDAANKAYVDANIFDASNYYNKIETDIRYLQIGTPEISFTILTASISPNFFKVIGDQTTKFTTGISFTVTGSLSNNRLYSVDVVGSTYDIGTNTTTIPLTSSPIDTVAGGSAIIAFASTTTMGGFLSLYKNPTSNLHAATKQYVDNSISAASIGGGGGGSITLGGLTDVNLANLVQGQFLNYNGSVWVNSTFTTLFSNNIKPLLDLNYLHLSGGIISGNLNVTGTLTVSANPTIPLGVATKQYVDAQSAIPLGVTTKQYVDAQRLAFGTFDEQNNRLNLVREDTITVQVPFGPTLSNILLNENLPKKRIVYGTSAGQKIYDFNEYYSGTFKFRCDYNELAVFKNGLKLIRSNKAQNLITSDTLQYSTFPILSVTLGPDAFIINSDIRSKFPAGRTFIVEGSGNNNGLYTVSANATYDSVLNNTTIPLTTAPVSTTPSGQIFYTRVLNNPLMSTGLLNNSTLYEFYISIDSGPNILVSIAGSSAQTFRDLQVTISAFFITNNMAVSVIFDNGLLFYSHIGGALSATLITETGTTIPLFSSITGTVTNPIVIGGAPNWTYLNEGDFSYYEPGPIGSLISTIIFHIPTNSNELLELIIYK